MPLSDLSHLTTVTYTGAPTASRVTGSISPTGGALLVVGVAVLKAGDDPGAISVSDTFSGTGAWSLHSQVLSGNSRMRVVIATARAGATPGSGTVTVAVTGTGTNWVVFVEECTGQSTSAPVPQSKSNLGTGITTLTVTLDSTPAATSMVVGMIGDACGSDTDITAGTGFTELSEAAASAVTLQAQDQRDLTGAATTCSWSNCSGTGASGLAGVAIEIAEAAAPAGGNPWYAYAQQ
jgi:hypothetical protein